MILTTNNRHYPFDGKNVRCFFAEGEKLKIQFWDNTPSIEITMPSAKDADDAVRDLKIEFEKYYGRA